MRKKKRQLPSFSICIGALSNAYPSSSPFHDPNSLSFNICLSHMVSAADGQLETCKTVLYLLERKVNGRKFDPRTYRNCQVCSCQIVLKEDYLYVFQRISAYDVFKGNEIGNLQRRRLSNGTMPIYGVPRSAIVFRMNHVLVTFPRTWIVNCRFMLCYFTI